MGYRAPDKGYCGSCRALNGISNGYSNWIFLKILCDCGLVSGRKEGKWTYYSLVPVRVQEMKDFLCLITTNKEDCICNHKEDT